MTRPLSNDLRERVVAVVFAGESCRSVAARFGVAVSSVVKCPSVFEQPVQWSLARWVATASVLEPHRAFIAERIRQTPHLTLHGLKEDCRTLTFVGALRHDGLAAPCVFDGPINGVCFRSYVEQQLVPVLKPGDIVIMDNLGSHKSVAVRQMIRAAGARLWFLPAYSPDLNPIEQAFAKIKHWMRQAQRRTVEETRRQVGDLIETIKPGECENYLANARYASVKR